MKAFRITRSRYADDVSGAGGMRFAGRWHPAGRRVRYAAVSESLARLEVMAHINRAQWPLDGSSE